MDEICKISTTQLYTITSYKSNFDTDSKNEKFDDFLMNHINRPQSNLYWHTPFLTKKNLTSW